MWRLWTRKPLSPTRLRSSRPASRSTSRFARRKAPKARGAHPPVARPNSKNTTIAYARWRSVRPAAAPIRSEVKAKGTGAAPSVAATLAPGAASTPRSTMAVGPTAAINLNDWRVGDSDRRHHDGRLRRDRQAKSQRKSKHSFHCHYDPSPACDDRRSSNSRNGRFDRILAYNSLRCDPSAARQDRRREQVF
jgi:hypothetical protein